MAGPLERGNESGRVRAASDFAAYLDVTAMHTASRDANAATRQLQAITNLMDAGVTRCTPDLRYDWVNRRYAQWIGRAPEAIAGRPIVDVLGESAYRALLPRFRAVLAGERQDYEEEVVFAGIGLRWIHGAYVPSRDAEGRIDGWVAVVTDITARKRLELALLESDRRKDEFLAVLAHELRNPLAPLRNGLHVARLSADENSALGSTIEMMDRQVEHLTRLVDDLLDVNRIGRGKIDLRWSVLPLVEVLAQSIESCRVAIDTRKHHLEMHLDGGPVSVRGDADRLTQVFANLISNAAKYSEPGGRIRVCVRVEQREAVVRVIDSGVGIARADLEKLFEIFSQVGAQDGGRTSGLGIGLYLSRALVELHGGTLEADSDGAGSGSTFTVRLPLHGGDAVPARSAPAVRPALAQQLRILVADDHADAAQSLAAVLRLPGHRVLVALDGAEAVELAGREALDVVFMDIGMPVLNGLEAAQRIRALPAHRTTLIVALTGWGQQQDRERTRAAGIDLHVAKPIDMRVLEKILEDRVAYLGNLSASGVDAAE